MYSDESFDPLAIRIVNSFSELPNHPSSYLEHESPALESEAQIPNLKIVTPTNLFSSVLEVEESHTPTPPQLLTVESSQLFKPIMPDMNTTFDLNSKDEGKIFSTKLIRNS